MSYDLFSPGYAADLSVAHDGIQIMLDEDIRSRLGRQKVYLGPGDQRPDSKTSAAGTQKRRAAETVTV